jgi:hypothetical protein
MQNSEETVMLQEKIVLIKAKNYEILQIIF